MAPRSRLVAAFFALFAVTAGSSSVEDSARPLIYFNRGGICWDPSVKNLTVMVNSIYNGWRMEEVWLDK